eukprot:5456971-Pleurochrysis_carterae.AAC.1
MSRYKGLSRNMIHNASRIQVECSVDDAETRRARGLRAQELKLRRYRHLLRRSPIGPTGPPNQDYAPRHYKYLDTIIIQRFTQIEGYMGYPPRPDRMYPIGSYV